MSQVIAASALDELDRNIELYQDEPELKLTYISEEEIIGHHRRDDDEEYHRIWSKLGKQQKINRLMEYTKHIAKVYNLGNAEILQLKKLFIEGINGDILHDSESVHYEQETGTILKIVNLQRDSETGEFYVASGHKPKSASPSATRHHIQKVKPLAFNQLRLKIEHT